MRFELFEYLYPYTGGIKRIIEFSIYVTLIFIVLFTMVSVIINKVKNAKFDFKKYIIYFLVITFSGVAFAVNMLINFPMADGQNSNEYNIFALISQNGFQKIYNYEYFRGLIEIVSFIPIGVLLYVIVSRGKVIKAIGYTAIISIAFELFGSWGKISKYYWLTLINNLLGVLIGVGIMVLCMHVINKCRVNNITMIFSQLPIFITFVAYMVMYFIYFTNVLGDIYPDYYKELDSNRIKVSYLGEESLSEFKSYPSLVDEKDYIEYAEKLFSMNDAKIDESKTKYIGSIYPMTEGTNYECIMNSEEDIFFCYSQGSINRGVFIFGKTDRDTLDEMYGNINYTEEEMRNILKKCGINIPESWHIDIEGNICNYSYYCEDADGIYTNKEFQARFDDKGVPYYIAVGMDFFWQITGVDGTYKYIISSKKYDDITIINAEQAYEKLCEGKCYAKGLVETVDKGSVDINVKSVQMVMQRDDINCLQYVYCFDVEPIEVEGQAPITKIYVPAMKLNY